MVRHARKRNPKRKPEPIIDTRQSLCYNAVVMSETKTKYEKNPLKRAVATAVVGGLAILGVNHVIKGEPETPEGATIHVTVNDGSIENEVEELVEKGLVEKDNFHGRVAETVRRNGGADVQEGEGIDVRVDNIPFDENPSQSGVQFDGDTIDTDSARPGVQPESGENNPYSDVNRNPEVPPHVRTMPEDGVPSQVSDNDPNTPGVQN